MQIQKHFILSHELEVLKSFTDENSNDFQFDPTAQ